MKKITLILGLLLGAMLPVWADPVDVETAQKAAETFLWSKTGSKAELQLIDYADKADFPHFYVFGTANSFVIIASDDAIQPVLGYSTNNPFGTKKMPENIYWWLKSYDKQIAQAVKAGQKATTETAQEWSNLLNGKGLEPKSNTTVAPLVQTKWGQNAPYNNQCPKNANGRAITGCVATSMAQLLYYHYHDGGLTTGIGSHAYTHPTYGLQSVDYSATMYDWDNMIESYASSYTTAQAEAVATLMYHCGVAVNMSYGTSASSAFSSDIPAALINYFNFSVTTTYKRRYSSDSTVYWMNDLKKELDAGRPMEYNGTGSGGHSFVCDGYDSEDKFHFNWGWNGSSYDGYYALDAMTPGSHNYNEEQAAVFGIKPASCNVDAPSNFKALQSEGTRDVILSWDAVTDASGYKLFRNGTMIDSLAASQTSYTDEKIPYGTNIYHIRSVDDNGEMSWASNYQTISVTFPAPSGLSASLANGIVTLSWDATQGASCYHIYRNDVLIAANITGETFSDNRPKPGNTTYYIKAVDAVGDESDASSSVSLTVPYPTPTVNDLRLSYSEDATSLSWTTPTWCYPQSSSAQLSYDNGSLTYSWNIVYYGHRYSADDLAEYASKSIYKISTRITFIGTYTLYIYTNSIDDQPDPESLRETRILNSTTAGWVDIDLSEPILITGDKDLWVIIKQENTSSTYPVPSCSLTTYNPNACYASMTSPTSLGNTTPDYPVSWFIRVHLTDAYTYNLYDNLSKVNTTPIAETNLSLTELDNGLHSFTVKTIYDQGESNSSNAASLCLGNNEVDHLTLNDDMMVVAPNSSLSVTNDIDNKNPASLVLENNAQLFNISDEIKATFKKNITGFNTASSKGGWHFMASPVTESIDIAESDLLATDPKDYDLYIFDQSSEAEWLNYKQNHFSTIDHKKGYLYAYKDTREIAFTGTVNNSSGSVPVSYTANKDFSGYNLIGNPFPCNATIDRPYLRIVETEEGSSLQVTDPSTAIAPMEGVVVKSLGTSDNSITFTKAPAPSKNDTATPLLTLNVTKGESNVLDNACISFDGDLTMEKLHLQDGLTQIAVLQNGKNYALAVNNGQFKTPICFKAAKDGVYTLNVSAPFNARLSILTLIDHLTGANIDLLQNPSYSFEAKTDDDTARFHLLMHAKNENENFAFVSDGELIVIGTGTLQVVDILGRVILSKELSTVNCQLSTPPGVYVLRLTTETGTKTQKIIIK